MSAVDPETKEDYERELKEVHNQLQLTTIHVTHNFEEAITLGDRIAVLQGGHIEQIGTPEQIFRHPTSEFVARFTLTRNIFEGEVQDDADGQTVFCVEGIKLAVATGLRGKRFASIRPEDILISKEPLPADDGNSLSGNITRIVDRGTYINVTVDVPPKFTCLTLHRSLEELGLQEQQKVFLTFAKSKVNVF